MPRCRTSPTSIRRRSQLKHDPGNTFSVPYTWGTTGLCYRSDLVKADARLAGTTCSSPGRRPRRARSRCWPPTAGCCGAGLLAQGYVGQRDRPGEARPRSRTTLIDAKKNLLAYDDTTFYSKLVSGEASLVHAWDGWCNYGIAENPAIKYVDPEGGLATSGSTPWSSRRRPRTRTRPTSSSTSSSMPRTHAWVAENIMYKVPNKAGMESLDKAMLADYPNIAMPPATSSSTSSCVDVGEAQKDYSPRRRRDAKSWRRQSRGPVSRRMIALPRRTTGPLDAAMTALAARPIISSAWRRALAWLAALMDRALPAGAASLAFFRARHLWRDRLHRHARQFRARLRSAILPDLPRLGPHSRASPRCLRSSSAIPPPMPSRRRRSAGQPLAAIPRHPALLDQLSHPHLCLDRAAQSRGAHQHGAHAGSASSREPLHPALYRVRGHRSASSTTTCPSSSSPIYTSLSRLDPSLIEASRDLGARRSRTFRQGHPAAHRAGHRRGRGLRLRAVDRQFPHA